ncbi:glycine zipper 2TM domain-containing protein [Bacilli bacterium]|uniref:glycine zipper 2TM domain-containing protein n=1 Tax=Oceanobacillus sp. FSL K6-0118 TaxID=2921418 RepID=UPI000622894E|nr:hypothetical protein WH51_15395 [Bacilli bacterium VT-13-104]PZD82988.1 glycine zipper 2TM domain-containing protein [Bacilli bacterium]PZD83997.1 glycine zipper 2TM domain-containing protein [Bacilli bacterium]PZD85921.1 glycine zipper 2TM domain-containing protein [Bacilli bacterium]RCO04531.1 glycine zipper 2TM domain-containing protein [Bacilli bacterium]
MNNFQSSIHTGDDSIVIGCSRHGAMSGAAYGSYIGSKIAGSTGATTGYILGAIIGAVFGPDDSFKSTKTIQSEHNSDMKQLL